MKIVIPGGSGQVGSLLAKHFHNEGHDVVVLSRGSHHSADWRTVQWDGESLGPWTQELEGADVLINLAGRSVNCRYTPRNRNRIWSSRVRSVRVLGQAVQKLELPPSVWLQASTGTIYSHRFDSGNDEVEGVIGGLEPGSPDTWRFSIDVARAWEGEVASLELPRTRTVLLRSAIILSADKGGAFDYLLGLVRFGLGGRAGSGRQFISWVHAADFIRSLELLISDPSISGPVNIASPFSLSNSEFMATLRSAYGARFGIPSPSWLIEMGTFLLRTESELVLKSRRVVPRRLIDAGFRFQFEDWETAAKELCDAWRAFR